MTRDGSGGARSAGTARRVPATIAALLAAAVTCAVMAIRNTQPFGPSPRGINDLSNQFVPFHAYFWDVLHGRADLSIAWNVGLGVPFLPDYAAYLSSPFAPLVALFPRDRIETAVFVITVLKIAVAAAVMTCYLLALRRHGSGAVAALLGAAYAVCGWTLDDGIYVTMWLDSLIALPAIALAMEWMRHRPEPTRFVVAAVVTGLFWWANAYSAIMATAGAGTLVLARTVAEAASWRDGVRHLLRSLAAVVLGVGLTSAILLPFLSAMSRAQASPERPFHTHPWAETLGRALPLTGGAGASPGLYVGTVVLVLAASLPLLTVPLRRRLTYSIGAVLVLLSMQWPPTMLVWHAFELPNGSQFRAAFAMCAWLVVCAWIAAPGVDRRPLGLLGGATAVALLAWWAGGIRWASEHTRSVALVACLAVALAAVALWAARRWDRAPATATTGVLVVLLGVGLVTEGTWTGVVADAKRSTRFVFHPDGGPIMDAVEASLRTVPVLPEGRVTGAQTLGRNEAYLLGIPGVDYYSSTIAAEHSTGLRGLGVTWTSNGLSVRAGNDSVIRALLGIRTALDENGTVAWTGPAAPLARLIDPPPTGPADSVWQARDRLAGRTLYTVPSMAGSSDGAAPAPVSLASGEELVLEVLCPPGTIPTLDAPDLHGTVRAGEQTLTYPTGWDRHAPRELERSSGPVTLDVTATGPSALPAHPVGCLDGSALEEVIAEPVPEITLEGSRIEVTWDEPVGERSAVLSVPAYAGWRCSTEHGVVEITPVQGLLAAPLDGASSLTCSFRQPRLGLGLALSALVLLVLVGSAMTTPLLARTRR